MPYAARTALASLLAIPPMATSFAQQPAELLLGPRSSLAGVPGVVDEVLHLDQGLLNGWAAVARVRGSSGSTTEYIVGVTGTDPSAPPLVLRAPGTVAGVAQTWFSRVALGAAGEVAYVSAAMNVEQSVWIDDTRVTGVGDAIGTTGWRWEGFTDLAITTGGELFVVGSTSFGGGFRDIVVRYPGASVVLAEGDPIGSLPFTVVTGLVDFSPSPDGGHWVSQVQLSDLTRALVADGDYVEVAPGARAKVGELLPASLGAPQGARWTSPLWRSTVNDRGQVGFNAGAMHAGGIAQLTVRDGRPALPFQPALGGFQVHSLDARGAAVFQDATSGFRAETRPLNSPAAGLDIDHDGVADAGWSVSFGSAAPGRPTALGALVVNASVDGPGFGDDGQAVVRLLDAWVGASQCNQVPNSTGLPASIVATGSRSVADDDLTLHAVRLPSHTFGLFVTSRQPGFAPGAGGGQGTLCLGGQVGRFTASVFNSGATGVGRLDPALGALPQVFGTVAAQPGETWYFQAWFRDVLGSSPTSNLTDAVAITFD